MKKLFLVCLLFSLALVSDAQSNYCAAMDELKTQIANDSGLLHRLRMAEIDIQTEMHSGRRASILHIPVLFHVIHNGDAYGVNENITDEQILSQIDALNRDFRKHNFDTSKVPAEFMSLLGDMQIEFCLARFDTVGGITSGIIRQNLGVPAWDRPQIEGIMKPTTIWDPNQYFNIWTCQFTGSLDLVLGYAQFPGLYKYTDGVVLRYDCVGTTGNIRTGNELGRVATHEAGHWIGLYHTWGDDNGMPDECAGSDSVADTPNERVEYYGRPSFPQTSCGSHDMFMNYMDYVDDSAKFMFTAGQVARARASLLSQRGMLLASINCNLTIDAQFLNFISPSDSVCTNNLMSTFKFRNNALENISYLEALYSIDGGSLQLATWTGFLHYREEGYFSLPVVMVGDGTHTISVTLFNPNHVGNDDFGGNDIGTRTFYVTGTSTGLNTPISEGFEGSTLPVNWSIQNPNGDITWQLFTSGGAFGTSSQCMMMDNYTPPLSVMNKKDGLITEDYNLLNPNTPHLTFDVAYARRSPSRGDTLSVFASLDCGHTWTLIWKRGSAQLATTTDDLTTIFYPTNTQWQNYLINLSPFGNADKIRFKFENFSQVGNRLFLDNVNLKSYGVSIQNLSETHQVNIFPNPVDESVHLELSDYFKLPVQYSIKNVLGQQLQEGSIHSNISAVATDHLLDGLYFINIESANHKFYAQKILVKHQ